MRPCDDGAHAELAEVEQRRREAGSRDHLVDLEVDGPGGVVPLADDAPAVAEALDALDGEVERERPAAEARVLERLQVADADGRLREHGGLHRPRRAEDHLPRPGRSPSAISKPELRLPITKTRRPR